MDKLKPCPFCGAEAEARMDGYTIKVEHKKDCLFVVIDAWGTEDEDIFEAWDRRYTEEVEQ